MIFARSWTVYIISYVVNPYGISRLHGHYTFACNKGSPKISQMEASMIALPTCKPSYRLYTCHNHWTQVRTRSAPALPVRKSFPKMLYLKMVKHGVSPFFTYDSLLECIVAPWKLLTSTILERQNDTFFF